MVNKIYADKKQQKVYNKAQELISESVNGNSAFQKEQRELLQEKSSFNLPIGRTASRKILNNRRFRLQESLTKNLFMESFFDLYKSSLLLDEDFKEKNENALYKLCEDTFASIMNEGITSWEQIKNADCNFTKKLYALCEETAKKSADELVNMDQAEKADLSKDAIIREKSDDDSKVKEEDKKELDDKTKKDKDAVAKAVKDKVVNTIKAEKEAAEKEKEEEEEIKEKTKTEKEKEEEEADAEPADEGEADDNSTDDSDSTYANKEENEEKNAAKKEEKEDDSKKSESFIFKSTHRVQRPNKLRNNSLFRSIQLNVAKKFVNESNTPLSEDVNMNMDLIFAESLAYYTLLECMNTIGITNLYPSDAKKLCKELLLK